MASHPRRRNECDLPGSAERSNSPPRMDGVLPAHSDGRNSPEPGVIPASCPRIRGALNGPSCNSDPFLRVPIGESNERTGQREL